MSDDVAFWVDTDAGESWHVTAYAGPVRPDGGDRRRVQITTGTYAAPVIVSMPAVAMDHFAEEWLRHRGRR